MLKKHIIIFMGSFFLSACSQTPEKQTTPTNISNENAGKNFPVVYGLLDQSEGQFEFVKYSFTHPENLKNRDKSEIAWIKLNNMEPLFKKGEKECQTASLLTDSDSKIKPYCNTENALFRDSTIDAGDVAKSTLGNAFAAAISFGLGATVASGHYTTYFDQERYYEFTSDEGIRKSVLNTLKEAKNYKKNYANNVAELDKRLAFKQNMIKSKLKLRTIDESGIFAGEIDPSFVSISLNKPRQMSMLTAWSKGDNLQKIASSQLKNWLSLSSLNLNCDRVEDWAHSIKNCSKNWKINDNIDKSHSVDYVIKFKKEAFLTFPFDHQDQNLALVIDRKGKIKIENRSDKYISLDSASLYIGKDVVTKKDLNIDIPPFSNGVVANVSEFSNSKQLLIKEVTKDDLNNKIMLGLAAKYKIIDSDKELTLLNRDYFSYKDIIKL